jgi:hypothetical protein
MNPLQPEQTFTQGCFVITDLAQIRLHEHFQIEPGIVVEEILNSPRREALGVA